MIRINGHSMIFAVGSKFLVLQKMSVTEQGLIATRFVRTWFIIWVLEWMECPNSIIEQSTLAVFSLTRFFCLVFFCCCRTTGCRCFIRSWLDQQCWVLKQTPLRVRETLGRMLIVHQPNQGKRVTLAHLSALPRYFIATFYISRKLKSLPFGLPTGP